MLSIKINEKEFMEEINSRIKNFEDFLKSINDQQFNKTEQFGQLLSPFNSIIFKNEDEAKKALNDELFNLKRALQTKLQSILNG